MAGNQKETFGEILLTGGNKLHGTTILVRDKNEKVMWCFGTAIPDAVSGFAVGCIFLKTDAGVGTGALYENKGTIISCSFTSVGTLSPASIPLEDGYMLIGNPEDVAEPLYIEDLFTFFMMMMWGGFGWWFQSMSFNIIPDQKDNDWYVVDAEMRNGVYELMHFYAEDNTARNIIVTRDIKDTADTPGSIIVEGYDYNGEEISEEILVGADDVEVAGIKAFYDISLIYGADWVKDDVERTVDHINIGFGNVIGLPMYLVDENAINFVLWNKTTLESAYVVTCGIDNLELNTVLSANAASFDGTKKLIISFNGEW